MKIKTSELTGLALNWAACIAEGNKPVMNPRRFGGISFGAFESELGYAIKNYSTDWAQGGPIIEREKIATYSPQNEDTWYAYPKIHGEGTQLSYGPTPLIAAMRCYVASKLGKEVDIPEELCLVGS